MTDRHDLAESKGIGLYESCTKATVIRGCFLVYTIRVQRIYSSCTSHYATAMSRHIKFLRYLKRKGGDIESIDVTSELSRLGLTNENKAYDFLNVLDDNEFVDWTDERPILRDPSIMGGIHNPNAPLHFMAKLTLKESDYLEERTIKVNQNKGLYMSIGVAVFLAVYRLT